MHAGLFTPHVFRGQRHVEGALRFMEHLPRHVETGKIAVHRRPFVSRRFDGGVDILQLIRGEIAGTVLTPPLDIE
jgi:hypothetical protein